MSKDPSGNIWACGRNGVIMKYDRTRWIADTIKIKFPYPAEYFLKSIEYFSGKAYVLASSQNTSTLKEKYYYLYGDINTWTIADSMIFDSPSSIIKWGNRYLYSGAFGKLYSVGLTGAWLFNNNNWELIYNSHASLNGIYGINENYILTVGDFQQALFYNGSIWESISDVFHISDPYFIFKSVWTNGYETFIVGYTFQGDQTKTIIWHGK